MGAVMQSNFSRMLVLAASAALLQACGGPKSSSTSGNDGGPMPTNRMYLYLTVESSEPGSAVVRANLNDGHVFGESFRLDGGDFFRACVNGLCRTMADNDSIFNPDYIARFDYQPGVDYVVSFNRQEGQDAPDSRIVLPPAFVIVTPANHQQVTDGDNVLVSWTPTGTPARVSLVYDAECTHAAGPNSVSSGTLGHDANGDGRESVSIDEIVDFVRSSSPQRVTGCSIDVTVQHELQGRVDPAFDDGLALGIVSRKVNLDFVPR
jgi:hypothetical protein